MSSNIFRLFAVAAAATASTFTLADPGVVSVTGTKETKKIHFTIEFVPSAPSSSSYWRPYQTCTESEAETILDVFKSIVERDTKFWNLSDEAYLPYMYENGLHPSFDITYDCPTVCDDDDDDGKDSWCDHLCMNHHTYLHHDLTTTLADDLRIQIHSASVVSLLTKHHVYCLGDIAQVEMHLLVSTSPYIGILK